MLRPKDFGLQEGRSKVEFFHGVNIDWLGKKWYFLAFSLIFSVAGLASMAWHWARIGSPVPLGVDFRGGTEIQVQFKDRPDIERYTPGRRRGRIQGREDPELRRQFYRNEVLISLPEEHNESSLDAGRQQIVNALHTHYTQLV